MQVRVPGYYPGRIGSDLYSSPPAGQDKGGSKAWALSSKYEHSRYAEVLGAENNWKIEGLNCHVHLRDDVAKKLEEHGGERGQEGQDGDGGRGQAYVPVP